MNLRTLLLATASAMLLAGAAHADDKTSDKDYVMLKVNGDEIKRSEVEAMWNTIFPGGNAPPFDSMDPKVKENVLRGVASEHVLMDEAKKSGITDEPAVKAKLEAADRQIVIQQFLKEKTKDIVSDDKLKAAYDEKSKALAGQEELHARHILVKTKEEAEAIEKKLKKGADFEKLAKDKSEDKSSGASGGDLGWFTADKMVPEFSKAAFALKDGEISTPVKSDFGWHIIQVEGRRKSAAPSFEEMRDSLRQDVGNKAVSEYVTGLMKNVTVTELDADGHSKEIPGVIKDEPVKDVSPAAGAPAPGADTGAKAEDTASADKADTADQPDKPKKPAKKAKPKKQDKPSDSSDSDKSDSSSDDDH